MKNDHSNLQTDSKNTQLTNPKKNWVEPKLHTWEYVNIGLKYGLGADGTGRSSAT